MLCAVLFIITFVCDCDSGCRFIDNTYTRHNHLGFEVGMLFVIETNLLTDTHDIHNPYNPFVFFGTWCQFTLIIYQISF